LPWATAPAYTPGHRGGKPIADNSQDWRGLLAEIERAATPRGRERLGCFSIEGTRLHERALRAGAEVRKALVAESYRADESERIRKLLGDLEHAGCELRTAPDEVLFRLTDGRNIGAVVGLVRLAAPARMADMVPEDQNAPCTLLVAVELDDPGNVGALVRTALASGCAGFVGVGQGDPFHPKAVRTSMGSLFRLPVVSYPSVEPLLKDLAALGVRTVGSVAKGGTPLPQACLEHRRCAIFVGSESFGLDESVRQGLDERVSIPMGSEIDSYSVNAAAAILLYAIAKGRGAS
jgi:TrmH family RNA methyltransferase